MRNALRLGPALLAGLVCAAPVAAQTYGGQPIDTSTCRDVSGQTEIDGIMQPYAGRACQQPDGTWVFVNGYGPSWTMPDHTYYYEPWYFGPPVLFGGTVVFLDRFHHHHHHFDRNFDRDRFGQNPNHFAAVPAQAPHTIVMRPSAPARAGQMWTGGVGGVGEGWHASGGRRGRMGGGAGGHFMSGGFGAGMHGH